MTEKSIDNVNELKEKIKNLSIGQLIKKTENFIDEINQKIDDRAVDEFSYYIYPNFSEGFSEYAYEILNKSKQKKIKDILGEN